MEQWVEPMVAWHSAPKLMYLTYLLPSEGERKGFGGGEPLLNPHLVLVRSTHLVLLFIEGHCNGNLDIILFLHLALLGTGLGCRDLGLTCQ